MKITSENFDLLWGENAGVIMGCCTELLKEWMRAADYESSEITKTCDEYRKEAWSGDYTNLIEVTRTYLYDVAGIETDEYYGED